MTDFIGQQLGNYHLVRFIGAGGYADVYLGEHVRLASQAAVKVLHTQLASDEEIQRFQEEGRMVAHLVHPHIIRIFDFDVATTSTAANVPFMVMEYAPNGSLRTRHVRGERLTMSTILPYVRQVAEALQYAHDHGLVHRDIKPENMLLGRNDEVLLSDFGTALAAQETGLQKTLQQVVGTVSYMAPEQFEGKARPASDQYSLAVVIYEWLSGERPFRGSATEIAVQHAIAPPPSLRAKAPSISPTSEQVILRALAKDPRQRFASVQEFADALEQAYHAQEIIAAASTNAMPFFAPAIYPEAAEMHSRSYQEPLPMLSQRPAPAQEPLILSSPSYAAHREQFPAQELTYEGQKLSARSRTGNRNPLLLLLAILLVVAGSTLLWFAIAHFLV